jgi:hypothetical protein
MKGCFVCGKFRHLKKHCCHKPHSQKNGSSKNKPQKSKSVSEKSKPHDEKDYLFVVAQISTYHTNIW